MSLKGHCGSEINACCTGGLATGFTGNFSLDGSPIQHAPASSFFHRSSTEPIPATFVTEPSEQETTVPFFEARIAAARCLSSASIVVRIGGLPAAVRIALR